MCIRDRFDPDLAEGFSASLDLRLGEHRFRADVGEGRLEVVPGEAEAPDAIVTTDAGTLLALAHRRIELDQSLRARDIEIDGDREAVARFLGLFPLPEPAAHALAT